jgi:hypothetical protein
MSLNKFTSDIAQKEWMKINAETVVADNLKFVTGDGNVVNLKTPTLGGTNWVLSTNGAGSCAFTDLSLISPTDPTLFNRTQNIDDTLTTAGNTQINGTTKLFTADVETALNVKTGDGLGSNNFSTPNLGVGGHVLSTDGAGNLSWISNGVLSIADLEAKTQNISLANTTPNVTQIDGTLRTPLITSTSGAGTIGLSTNVVTTTAGTINLNANTLQQSGKDILNTDGGKNITTTLTTTQTTFTADQELITKKFFDDNVGGQSATSLNFTGLQGSTIKTNLLTNTTQTPYGVVERYTMLNNVSTGQPVIFDYTSGNIRASSIGGLPSQHEILGIAVSDTLAGADADILSIGYITARRTSTIIPSSQTVILDNTTNGTLIGLTNNTTFTDSGAGGSYNPNENYSITFDAGSGYTVNMTLNSFAFEHTTSQMYDRLGVQTSNDGISFTNTTIPFFQTSSTTTPPYSTSFGGGSWNSTASKNGWILPKDTARAILLGGVPGNTFPVTLTFPSRFVRFYFFSDGSAQDDGWNITLQPNTPYPTSAIAVAEGTTLYLDNTDNSKVSTDNTSQIVIGYCAYSDANNDSLLINCRPPRS